MVIYGFMLKIIQKRGTISVFLALKFDLEMGLKLVTFISFFLLYM